MRTVPVFDAHCDTVFRCCMTGEGLLTNEGMVSLEKAERSFGCYSQFFALFGNRKKTNHPTYDQLLSCFRWEVERNSDRICLCRTAAEALDANRQGKSAAFLSVEGADLLNCDPDKLEQVKRDGVFSVHLTWNNANLLSGSSREDSERGLSETGRSFLRKMEELGITVDVSHLSDAGFWDVEELAERPYIASHSNARVVHDHVRNLTDRQIMAIIARDGFVGLNVFRDFVGRGQDLDAVYAHADHILSLGGGRCLGIGGDWDGCDPIDSLSSIDRLCDLYEYFLQRGLTEALLNDIFYNNLMRVVSVS